MTTLFAQSQGQGPDLVLLHGWGTHSGVWQFIIDALKDDFRVTVIDLPGFGKSRSISDYSNSAILSHLANVAPEHAIWLGWSLGGLLATQFALCYPHRVSRLICVGSTPKFIQAENWPGVSLELLTSFAQSLQHDYEATLRRFVLLQFYGVALDKNLLNWLEASVLGFNQPEVAALMSGLHLLETTDLRDELKKVHCPVLYMLGKIDRLVPAQIIRQLQHTNPHIDAFVFPKASHAPFLSHQDQFLIQLRRFIHG